MGIMVLHGVMESMQFIGIHENWSYTEDFGHKV
jgi:hypothetical protein